MIVLNFLVGLSGTPQQSKAREVGKAVCSSRGSQEGLADAYEQLVCPCLSTGSHICHLIAIILLLMRVSGKLVNPMMHTWHVADNSPGRPWRPHVH